MVLDTIPGTVVIGSIVARFRCRVHRASAPNMQLHVAIYPHRLTYY
jgi:hypothetical protein